MSAPHTTTSLGTFQQPAVPHPITSIEVLPTSDPLDIAMFDAIPGFVKSIECESRKFSNHYGGFVSLVSASYDAHVANNRTLSDKLPLQLFLYYCEMALWCKLLHVFKKNSQPLSALTADLVRFESIGNFYLPPEVIEYIDDVGNFIAPDSVEYVLDAPFDFSMFHHIAHRGLLGHLGEIGNDQVKAWCLLETPLPYVVCRSIQECLGVTDPLAQPTMWSDTLVAPADTNYRVLQDISTDVLGYYRAEAFDAATVATLQNLGWSPTQAPLDMRSSYLCLSPSTLNYIAHTLSIEMPHFRLFGCERMVSGRGRCSQTVLLQVSNTGLQGELSETTYSTPKDYYNVAGDMWSRGAIFRFQLMYDIPPGNSRFSGCGWYYAVTPPPPTGTVSDGSEWLSLSGLQDELVRASTFMDVHDVGRHVQRCPSFAAGRFELPSTAHGALLRASLVRYTQRPP